MTTGRINQVSITSQPGIPSRSISILAGLSKINNQFSNGAIVITVTHTLERTSQHWIARRSSTPKGNSRRQRLPGRAHIQCVTSTSILSESCRTHQQITPGALRGECPRHSTTGPRVNQDTLSADKPGARFITIWGG